MTNNVLAGGDVDLAAVVALLGHNWLLFVMGVVVLWLMVTRLAETSEAAAKILGPLGARIVKHYHQRRASYRQEVAAEAKELALELVPKVMPADYETVKVQLHNVIDRVTDLEVENAALRSFVIYDEEWHFTLVLTAAKAGENSDFPHRFTWLEFREKWRTGWRPAHLVTGASSAVGPEQGPLATLITEVGQAARAQARRDKENGTSSAPKEPDGHP